jgi:hypothetical protein
MRSAAILSFIFLAVALSSAQAEPASIEGWWRGSGIVTYGNGADNVQCRVRYTRLMAKSFAVSSHCTTESGRYELAGRVVNSAAIATPAGCRARREIKTAGFRSSSTAIAFR